MIVEKSEVSPAKSCISMQSLWKIVPAATERKLNVHKMFRRRPGRLLNVLCMYVQFTSCAYGDKNKQRRVATLKLSLVEHLLQLETISMIDHWERPSNVLWRSSCQTRSKAPDMYKNASYFKWGICVKWSVNVVLFREADAHINHRAGSLIDCSWRVNHPLNI